MARTETYRYSMECPRCQEDRIHYFEVVDPGVWAADPGDSYPPEVVDEYTGSCDTCGYVPTDDDIIRMQDGKAIRVFPDDDE